MRKYVLILYINMIFLKVWHQVVLISCLGKKISYLKSIFVFECLIHLSLKIYICVNCSVVEIHFSIRKYNSKYVFSVTLYSSL